MKAATIAAWMAVLAVPGEAFAQSIGCAGLTGPEFSDCLRQQSELDTGTASSGTLLDSTAGVSTSGLSTSTTAIGSGSLAGSQGTPGTFSLQPAPSSSFGLIPSTTSPSLTTPSLSSPLSASGTASTSLNSSGTGSSFSGRTTSSSSSSSSSSLGTFDNSIGGTVDGMVRDDLDPFDDDDLLD